MVAKMEMNPIERIRKIIKDQNGLLLTADLKKYGIPRTYLSNLVKKGEIQRVSRGIYTSPDYLIDEMATTQARYKKAIFSHESALYLLDLTDRTPLFFSMTVPAGYNAASLKANGIKVYFVKRSLYQLGLVTAKSPHGNDIRSFNLERTICDVLRNRNQIDSHFINESLKRYVKRDDKNIHALYAYAKKFRVQKFVREYIEVLL